MTSKPVSCLKLFVAYNYFIVFVPSFCSLLMLKFCMFFCAIFLVSHIMVRMPFSFGRHEACVDKSKVKQFIDLLHSDIGSVNISCCEMIHLALK